MCPEHTSFKLMLWHSRSFSIASSRVTVRIVRYSSFCVKMILFHAVCDRHNPYTRSLSLLSSDKILRASRRSSSLLLGSLRSPIAHGLGLGRLVPHTSRNTSVTHSLNTPAFINVLSIKPYVFIHKNLQEKKEIAYKKIAPQADREEEAHASR